MKRVALLLIICLLSATAEEVTAQAQWSDQAKIQSAMKAAPPSISSDATIKDHDGTLLRPGTNEWTCYPDMPELEGRNPMCLDRQWAAWWDAYLGNRDPHITQIGIAYMLEGGSPGSNTDPYAEGPTADNEWAEEGWAPHVMIILPDLGMYADLPSDPDTGGPWVMWRDTPYAHIMAPTAGRTK